MVRDSKQLGHPPPTPASPHRGLIVGNYCHDVLFHDGSPVAESLGGAVSFISAVLSGLSIPFDSVSKVGPDFKYSPAQIPIKVHGSNTTLFHAHFDSCADEATAHRDRLLKRVAACDPISPSDLPTRCYDFGMAVGVGGEIQPQTLEKMTEICRVVFVDIQALIREFDPMDGTVKLVRLKDSGFYHLLPRIGFLKASSEEALFMDVEEVRRRCCVVVTNGKEGCSVYWKDGDFKIQPFTANQVDPTGAGDSFLGGLVGGLAAGLAVPDAALLGNLFGSLTVGQVGLPKFDPRLLQGVQDEVQRRKMQSMHCFRSMGDESKYMKPAGHDQFHTSLAASRLLAKFPVEDLQSPRKVDELPRAIPGLDY
ncbi:inositol 3-kinase isoform X1 [Punica granatum]|uniref:Inositol 3-kinase isoform X1 n=1 Tax=Punica granatum TaxID=22663 RepID=A0A218W318_PUNGR|nr:inositol 3-kinase isoform X1 [Punica granatum]OWM66700.1 hypothetical protein CDL15_Pgr010351 [Punica granatum]